MSAFCRDCLTDASAGARQCATCRGHRIVSHAELDTLTIAHLDCDAFYAAIEKRDDPSLADKPVIVGGGKRGVVSTCCYIARIDGVRSAMPMFKALALCPKAIVIKPRMAKYVEEGRRIRALMRDLTPMVQPLSLDEAFLDLSGTEQLHGQSPAKTMAALAKRIESEIGITVSIGLSHNKFLAKLASELRQAARLRRHRRGGSGELPARQAGQHDSRCRRGASGKARKGRHSPASASCRTQTNAISHAAMAAPGYGSIALPMHRTRARSMPPAR